MSIKEIAIANPELAKEIFSSLSPRASRIMEMRHIEGRTYPEIGSELQLTKEKSRDLFKRYTSRIDASITEMVSVARLSLAIRILPEEYAQEVQLLQLKVGALKAEVTSLQEIIEAVRGLVQVPKMQTECSGNITELDLTLKTINALHAVKIFEIGELMQCTDWELFKIPDFGPRRVTEVRRALALHRTH
jgi:hypothetical protein